MKCEYIKGYEGNYKIDDKGNVYSCFHNTGVTSNVLKPFVKNGYLAVNLYEFGVCKHYYVHRLVAEAFVDNPNNYKCVNHIDCNKKNNNFDNLEWCSQKHNIIESIKNNLQIRVKPVEIENLKTGNKYKFLTMKQASIFLFNHERKLSRLKEYYGNHFSYKGWFIKVGDENVIN